LLMSNVELRMMKEEVGVPVLIKMVLLRVHSTLYLVLRTNSCYLILAT